MRNRNTKNPRAGVAMRGGRGASLLFVLLRTVWLLLLVAALLPQICSAQRAAVSDPTTDRLIVKWRAGSSGHAQIRAARDGRIDRAHLDRLVAAAGSALAPYRAMSGDAQVIRLFRRHSLADAQTIAARLAKHPEIEFAVADQKRFPAATANDSYFAAGLQKNLSVLNIPSAWDITTGAPDLVVAVLDTRSHA